jgi:hypothetical protein
MIRRGHSQPATIARRVPAGRHLSHHWLARAQHFAAKSLAAAVKSVAEQWFTAIVRPSKMKFWPSGRMIAGVIKNARPIVGIADSDAPNRTLTFVCYSHA